MPESSEAKTNDQSQVPVLTTADLKWVQYKSLGVLATTLFSGNASSFIGGYATANWIVLVVYWVLLPIIPSLCFDYLLQTSVGPDSVHTCLAKLFTTLDSQVANDAGRRQERHRGSLL